MVKKKNTPTHGGARRGAGRKDQVTKKRMNFMIDFHLADMLGKEQNKSELVNKLLKDYYADTPRTAP